MSGAHSKSLFVRRHPILGGAAIALVLSGLGLAVPAIAQTVAVALNSGDSATATCSGTKLSADKLSKISYSLTCAGPVATPPTTIPTTTTVPPTTTTLPGNTGTTSWWQPNSTAPIEWQWYLAGALDTSNAVQMGTGDATYDGQPGGSPTVYDIDGIDNPASTVGQLHGQGAKVICYIEVGTAGDYGDDYSVYYSEFKAAGDLGSKLAGYPENFLNINSASTVAIVESIISTECNAKGFDAVETDLDETFGNNEGKTGFTISQADEVSYLTTLAGYMHSIGLAWVAKDVDDTGSQSFVDSVAPLADTVITEQCAQYKSCSLLAPFTSEGKPIFEAEYKGPASGFCPTSNADNFNAVLFDADLNGKVRTPCR